MVASCAIVPTAPFFNLARSSTRDAIYAQKLEPAARAYLTKLREQAYIEVKPGYVDSGATAGENSNHPVVIAANGGDPHHEKNSGLKKKKKFLIF